MKENKKTIILSIIAVLILIVIAIGVSYAYYANRIETPGGVDVDTEITSQSNVTYTPGNDIVLSQAEPGAKAETEFSVSLAASNKTEDTITYGLVWNISENDFEYEYDYPSDPQLVYTLYYSVDNEVWVPYVENADCTTWSGSPRIVDGLTLTADANTTSTVYWRFVLEYKSYDYNQATNMGKVLKGAITLDSNDI